jgi:biotin transport system substrate-specific component
MTMHDSYLVDKVTGDCSWAKDCSWVRQVAAVLGASTIISLCAPISIPLFFTPIPIAIQAHVILLISCLLGSKRAALAVLAFLLQGAMGLPVFAGGRGGIYVLAGPTGGYLLGYLLAAFITGYLMERSIYRTPSKAFAVMGLGNLVVYLFGISWLSRYLGWESALVLGMAPFLIGDLLKLVVATKFLKGLRYFYLPAFL